MRTLVRWGMAVAVCGALLLALWPGWPRREAPKLVSAYGDLTAYWSQVAATLGISQNEARLHEWMLAYGEGGAVDDLRLVVYVEPMVGKYDVYTINQARNGKATWARVRLNPPALHAVPAQAFFAELNAVGYKQLEGHQAISPPIRSWFHTIRGTINYGAAVHTHTMQGARILPAGPAGITMRGIHGSFQMTRNTPSGSSTTTAAYPGDSPPVYLMPAVGCGAQSPSGEFWVCPGDP